MSLLPMFGGMKVGDMAHPFEYGPVFLMLSLRNLDKLGSGGLPVVSRGGTTPGIGSDCEKLTFAG